MIETAEELAVSQGVVAACAVLAVPRSSLYRARPAPVAETVTPASEPPARPAPPRALSPTEQEQVRPLDRRPTSQRLAQPRSNGF
jgi:hypothetical protein